MGKYKYSYDFLVLSVKMYQFRRRKNKWDINLPATIVIFRFISHFKFHAPCFVLLPRTLLMQLAQSRQPHGTRKLLLSAAAFLP